MSYNPCFYIPPHSKKPLTPLGWLVGMIGLKRVSVNAIGDFEAISLAEARAGAYLGKKFITGHEDVHWCHQNVRVSPRCECTLMQG